MKVELLAPAGNMEAAISAFKSGSDAIYLAGPTYGARAYANNFSLEELQEIIKYAHIREKNVYVTVNTIIYESEIEDAIKFLDFLYLNDCDGVIVQDLGLADIISKRYPDMALHASTQMNIHTVKQAQALKEMGFKRIVLAREVPFNIIKEIKEKVDVELEVFIHGALCVSYSGNCYFSSIVGKRSGNRGRCAQPCRLTYKLDDDKEKYYLSPKDLCTIEYVNKLVEIGVDSLKIEGRMKRSEYVAQVVSSYRKVLDNTNVNIKKEIEDLKLIFNRDFTKGFLFDEDNNNFSNLENQNHQGLKLGRVISIFKDKVKIKLERELNFGDSIRLVGKITDAVTVNQMYVNEKLVKKAKIGEVVSLKVHEEGLNNANVFITTSSDQIESLRNIEEKNKITINGNFYFENNKFILKINDGENIISVESLEEAVLANNDLSSRIKEQINKTGNTIYVFDKIDVETSGMMIPIKEVNRMRRDALALLDEARSKRYLNRKIVEYSFNNLAIEVDNPIISVKVRNEEQLKVALDLNVSLIYVEGYDLYKKYSNLENVKYANPRINGEKEIGSLTSSVSNLKNNNTSVYMNVVNSFSAYKLFSEGAKSVGLSIELAKDDIIDLINSFNERYNINGNFEMMVYGYYELIISKYCPLQKKMKCVNKNCNLCLKENHYLIDRMGFAFPIIKGEGCYTKILNSKRVHLVKYLKELKDIGINKFLLDFSIEDKDEVKRIIEMYQKALNYDIILMKEENVTYGHFNEGVL